MLLKKKILNITMNIFSLMNKRSTGNNSTYPKGGVSCSKDSFVGNGSLVFQIKFCGKSPALRVAAFQDQKQVFSQLF